MSNDRAGKTTPPGTGIVQSMKVVLDTNCFIHSTNMDARLRDPIQGILNELKNGTVELYVSRHTLAELEEKHDAAFDLAKTLPVVPHWPIGKFSEQVGSWEQMEGTWDDAAENESRQGELSKLANSGNSLRDRGAFLDALRAKADAFVTSDKQLVKIGPAKRISEKFGLRVISPIQLLEMIKNKSATLMDDILQFAQANGKVCPLPKRWKELWEMLPDRKRVGIGWEPPLPLILAAWNETSDSEKRERLFHHIKYAGQHGALLRIADFLRSLQAHEWHYSQ